MSTEKFVRVQVVDASKVSGKNNGYLIKDWDGHTPQEAAERLLNYLKRK